MNTRPAPPPPRLVHKRPMRRIHQSNNPVVHIARQLRCQMRRPKPPRKLRHLRHRRQLSSACGRRIRGSPRSRLRHINPRIPISFLTRKRPCKNLRRVQRLKARQRRNLFTLPRTRLKPPPMVLARHSLPIEPPRRQRNPPVRTKITHRKDLPIVFSSQQKRHSQQHRLSCRLRAQLPAPHRRIPIPKDQLRRRPRNPFWLDQLIHHRSA